MKIQGSKSTYVDIDPNLQGRLEQFIRGSLLGDGSIPKIDSNSKAHRLTFGHGPKQLSYLEWKHEFLASYLLAGAITKRIALSSRYKSGSCISYHFKSIAHPVFTKFYRLYYPSRKRLLNREDIKKIDEFALAIWYMDDGNVWHRKKRTSCIAIHTTSFSLSDVHFLIGLLKDKWGIDATYLSPDNGIRISVYSCQKFLELTRPYIIKGLEYKWVLNKEEELLES